MRPDPRLGRPLLAIMLGLAVAACGSSSPTQAPATNAVAGATGTPAAPSAAATDSTVAPSPADSIAMPSIALPSLNGAPELEALLPDSLNGVKLMKISQKGIGSGDSNPQMAALLAGLGKSAGDVEFAFGVDPTGKNETAVFAYELAGTDPNQLLGLGLSALKSDSGNQVSNSNVGGRNVTVVSGGSSTLYFFTEGPAVLGVSAATPAEAATALQAFH